MTNGQCGLESNLGVLVDDDAWFYDRRESEVEWPSKVMNY